MFFPVFIFLLSPAASSLWERPNHLTTSKVAYFKRKYAEEEDVQESLHGYLQKVTHFSFFYHLVRSTVKMSDCASVFWSSMWTIAVFFVFGLGSLLRKEDWLYKQYNSWGLFSHKKIVKWAKCSALSPSYGPLQSLRVCSLGKQCLFMLLSLRSKSSLSHSTIYCIQVFQWNF